MDAKLVLILIFTLCALLDMARAEFLYNRYLPKQHELEELGLKCIPGRTVIKITSKPVIPEVEEENSEEDGRRTHMRFTTDDESCQMCVCSVEAKDEYCSNRPAMNVNECMRMAVLTSEFQKNEPFDHERTLSYRIRRVGDGSNNAMSQKCTPFVSMYSDCTPENRCEGCHRCTCSAQGRWVCETTTEGCVEKEDEDTTAVDEKLINDALNQMMKELKEKANPDRNKKYVPDPSPPPDTILVRKINKIPAWNDYNESANEEEPFVLENLRKKRSVQDKKIDAKEKKNKKETNGNHTIIFHNTIDEKNEDSLKNTNISGTLPATKMDIRPLVSRRFSLPNNASMPLQIEYTPPIQSQHAGDNKVDTSVIHDDQLDMLVHHKIYEMIGNQSQASRDKDLSKLVVNELKGGVEETIGDKNSPVISNITFTPENDTLTAMAFIAGNLLNKLWNIEKDSDDSLETEHMKHKKINDLLELFKEPLNLRQETFLKNALQHLSTAIENKNVNNVTLCEKIEELKNKSGIMVELNQKKTNLQTDPNTTPQTDKLSESSKKSAAIEALSKIDSILKLIKKYENTQNAINNIKNSQNALINKKNISEFNSTIKKSLNEDKKTNDLTKDEKITLNVFGNLLESLTKLIIPNKKGRKIIKGIKGKNILTSDKHLRDKYSNWNLTEMSLTTKDKIVLDYLTHIQNNPKCILNKNGEIQSVPDIDGDLLLNLSNFFKIKSMSDLLKLVDTANKKDTNTKSTDNTKIDNSSYKNFNPTETTRTKTTGLDDDNKEIQLKLTREKLKNHLKTILEDLLELQKIGSNNTNDKNIEISEALPCIYNLLNNKHFSVDKTNTKSKTNLFHPKIKEDPVNKVSEIFSNLKKELKHVTQTRRSNDENGKPPKSAIVWERTVKNLGKKSKLQTRRNLQNNIPKSIDDVKTIISKTESFGSNTYKSIAYLAEIPPAERLLLLKILSLDTNKYISVLSDLDQSVSTVDTLPSDQYTSISEFLENVVLNLNLNKKVVNSLDKSKKDSYLLNKTGSQTNNVNIYNTAKEEPSKTMKAYNKASERGIKIVNVLSTPKELEKPLSRYNTVKLSRDQIINQLIKNRMLYYLKLKEDTGDRKGEINIELAQKILLYLEIGNSNLARELFKVFVSQKKKMEIDSLSDTSDYLIHAEKLGKMQKRKLQVPEPLIQFEDPTENKETWLNQDPFMKQLMDIKNMM